MKRKKKERKNKAGNEKKKEKHQRILGTPFFFLKGQEPAKETEMKGDERKKRKGK